MDNKYAFLMALQLGESYSFDITPTLQESRRKVPASRRLAYWRIMQGIKDIMSKNPNFAFSSRIDKSNDRKLIITLTKAGDRKISENDLRSPEKRSEAMKEEWKKRKQKEEAPLLPGQLEEAAAVDLARRTAGAIKAQTAKAEAPKYDPVKIARLVAAHCSGQMIQKMTDAGEWINDPTPTWTLATDRYRVKPLIREWFLIVARDGKITAGAESIQALPHHDPERLVHVREILVEEEA